MAWRTWHLIGGNHFRWRTLCCHEGRHLPVLPPSVHSRIQQSTSASVAALQLQADHSAHIHELLLLHTIRRRQKENLPRNLTKQSNGEATDCWPAAASRTRGRAFIIWARSRRRETARGTRATRPPFFSSALASLPLPAPPAPTGTAGRSAAVALVRPPFPRRLSLSVWCTVCTLYVGWAIGLVRRSRWTPMPTPSRPGPGPPKSRNQKRASLSFTVHTTESERGSRTRWRVVRALVEHDVYGRRTAR